MGSPASPPRLANLAFIEGEPEKLREQCQECLTNWKSIWHTPALDEAMAGYKKQRALNLVWMSNKLEGTLPSGMSQRKTYPRILSDVYDTALSAVESTEREGVGECSQDERQIRQHMRAYLNLCGSSKVADEPLTESVIKRTHEVLMRGLLTEDGFVIDAGKYRATSVFAGDHNFPPPYLVQGAMTKIVEEYNQKFAEDHDAYELASWLLYQVLTIHPFQDGNGRLCRLLACYSLMRDGLPFPVTITSGHRKSQKHFVWALTRDRSNTHGRQPHVSTIIVASVWQAWNNFYTNQQYNPALCEGDLPVLCV